MTGRREKIVGVIGGMGPEATVDFLRRLIAATPARDDSDHIRVLVDSNPKIPSRIAALIEGGGEDPAPVLCDMARGLEKQGADFLVVPCNTAHFYLPAIAASVKIPVLDMVARSISVLAAASHRRIGMLASPAVRVVGLYEARLCAKGMTPLFADAANETKLLGVIRDVKAGKTGGGVRKVYAEIAGSLAGVDAFLIACTELSILGAPEGISQPCIDALDVLVAATIAEARG